MDSSNFINKANWPTPQVEILTRQKLFHFRRDAILSKTEIFVPVTRAEVFIRENFHPGYFEISVQASCMDTSSILGME